MASRSVGAFLLWLWWAVDGARPETEVLDETRLVAAGPAAAPAASPKGSSREHVDTVELWKHAMNRKHAHASDVKPPKKSNPSLKGAGDDQILNFPLATGLFHIGMKPPTQALNDAIGQMSDATLNLDAAVNATHKSFDKHNEQLHHFDQQLDLLDPMLDSLDGVKKQFSDLEPGRTESFDHIPWTTYSDDGSEVRAIDWHKERWKDGVDGQRPMNSLIQIRSGGNGEVADKTKRSAKMHHDENVARSGATFHEDDDEEHHEAHDAHSGARPSEDNDGNDKLSPAAKVALGTESLPGANGDWSHLDKEELIKAAGELVPPDKKSQAEALWRALPEAQLREWMPKYFKNIRAEADMKKYKASLEASDFMDDTGQNLAENAAKTMKSLVNVHKKMEEWHNIVKTSVKDVDKVQDKVDGFKNEIVDHLKDNNKLRLSALNALVGSARIDKFAVSLDVPPEPKRKPVTFSKPPAAPFDEDAGHESMDSLEDTSSENGHEHERAWGDDEWDEENEGPPDPEEAEHSGHDQTPPSGGGGPSHDGVDLGGGLHMTRHASGSPQPGDASLDSFDELVDNSAEYSKRKVGGRLQSYDEIARESHKHHEHHEEEDDE